MVVDQSGAIQQVNAEREVLFGYHRDELIGRPLEQLVAERFHQAHVFDRGKYFEAPTERKLGIRADRLSSLFEQPLGRGQAGKAPDSGSGNPRFES